MVVVVIEVVEVVVVEVVIVVCGSFSCTAVQTNWPTIQVRKPAKQ